MKLPTATKWRFCDFNIPQRRVGVLGKRYKWLLKYISLPDHPCLTFEHATHVCSISDTGFVILLLKGYAAISSNRKKKKKWPNFPWSFFRCSRCFFLLVWVVDNPAVGLKTLPPIYPEDISHQAGVALNTFVDFALKAASRPNPIP